LSYTKTAEMIFDLMPLLDNKFIRPIAHQFRTIITPMQIHIMCILVKGKATMTELSNEMAMSKQQMTPIIDKLVSENFVQRDYDNIDRRMIWISLTSSGLAMLEKVKEKALTLLENQLKCLDQNDLLCLNNALIDLGKIINKIN